MDNLMEMDYVINGEKYKITVTKVEEFNDENENCTCTITNEQGDLQAQLPEYEFAAGEEVETPYFASVSDIPEGMSLDTWLFFIKEYGIIITK